MSREQLHRQSRRDFFRSASTGVICIAGASPAVGSQAKAGSAVVPRPRFMQVRDSSRTELRVDMPVLIGKSLAAIEHQWASRPLLRKIREKPSIQPSILQDANAALPTPSILIGRPGEHEELTVLAKQLRPKLGAAATNSLGEGYLLATGLQGIRIAADTPAGVFHAAQTIVQAVTADSTVPGLHVADAPDVPFRGIHFSLDSFGSPPDLPTIERFIREILPRYKANTLIARVGYRFRFRSHPEVSQQPMLDEVHAQTLARVCRAHNIRLIPLINCFGHQSWSPDQIGGLLGAYPQFNETPCLTPRPPVGYSWCASDPRIAPIVCDLIDELITAFEADAIHVGMDEVLALGQCPFCRRKNPAELYAKVVNEFHDHVVGRRKVQMLMWGDRLIDGRKTPYNPMNGSRNGTHPALHMIPKDIFLCDWHYHLHDSYPSVEMFRDAGFDFVACGWQKKDAIQAFQSYARKHGGKRYLGYLATNWYPFVRIARYMVEGVADDATVAEIRNFAECLQLGMELAWSGG
jgi:hypothetical protein